MEEPVSHDRWLVSYSDFVTLLFALFVVLFATSYEDNQAIRKISHAIHSGFQEMGTHTGEPGGLAPAPAGAQEFGPSSAKTPVPNSRTEIPATAGGVNIVELRRQLEVAMGQEIRNKEVDMRFTPEGFVISLKDLGFFNSGEAELRPGAADKIERIAKVLALHKLDIRIEGHSDDQPINTPLFRSNWELSTARATAVLLMLIGNSGVDPHKISVAGYGQYRPIADNSTPEGRRMNRRVDLVVVAPTF